MEIDLTPLIITAGVLFCLGMFGVIMRRNVLVVLMSIELMLNAVNLSFVSFSRFNGDPAGHLMVLMVFVVAAAEVAVAVAIIINMYKLRQTLTVDRLDELRG